MIRDLANSAPMEGDFLITVRCSVYEYPLRLWVGMEDTVGGLKSYMGERVDRFMDEMTLLVSRSHPYPLATDMRLGSLLAEHHHLLLLVHEGGDHKEEPCWWSQEVPERYLGQTETGAGVLDFRYLAEESLGRIRSWLYREREVEEIWLLGTHPQVMEILYAIAEDVLSLVRLRRIVIESPDRAGYKPPPKSAGRVEAFRQLGEVSRLRRDGLVYLNQHLLLDQYRDTDEVEIWLDGGLLGIGEDRIRFYP